MSHTTTLKSVVIRDVVALQQAAAELAKKGIDCELVANAEPRMYYENQLMKHTGRATAEYVLKLNGCRYDVAFCKQEDGTYAPIFDEWQNHVGNAIGAACPLPDTRDGKVQHQIGQFMQEYARYAAINAAVAQGYSVESCMLDAEGNYQLQVMVA